MGPENQLVASPAAPSAGPRYPILLLRLWLVRARLKARAGARAVRRWDSADDRRLVAMLVAAGTALIVFLGCFIFGFAANTAIILVALGFFVALSGGLVLLFGPDDYDCKAELEDVTGLLPGAKQVWDEQRAAARATRAVRRAAARAARAERRATRRAEQLARRGERSARTQADAVETPAEELVELVLVDGPAPALAALLGDGAYTVPVLGEVHVGRILAEACGDELPPIGQDKVLSAVVQFENTFRDSQGVSVEIAGRKVGHLSRADARALRHRVDQEGEKFKCRAAIHAGWKGGRVHYDLRLDVNLGADRPSGVVGL